MQDRIAEINNLQVQLANQKEEEEKKESLTTNTEQNRDDVNVREHRTGHVMMLAPQGIILVGGLGYNARFQSDVQTVKLF